MLLSDRKDIVAESVSADFEREKLELRAVLASSDLQRAPVQAQLLDYLCSRYFAGTADQLNEYAIAFEALGRPPHFDNKRDSIVRVEIHGLRKRLRDYYAAEGSSHAAKIQIPLGQYAPTFTFDEDRPVALIAESPAPATPALVPPVPSSPLQSAKAWKTKKMWWIGALVPVVAVAAVFLLFHGANPAKRPANSVAGRAYTPETLKPSEDIRIMAGVDHGSYVDGFGHLWQSDRFFNGGTAAHGPDHAIAYTHDRTLYQSRREGAFSYDIPLKNGVYELRLHFAETVWGEDNIAGGGEASRLFHIHINDREVLHLFDVIGNAGPGVAAVLAFKDLSPMADGKLHIRLVPLTDLAFLNGIEITPGIPGRMQPIRLIARDSPYADAEGRYWLPDRCSKGGQLVARTGPISNTSTPELYQGERFGNFSYHVAVPPGRYRLTLCFAERWFSPDKPAGGGAGSRSFNVYSNGAALLQNFDIYQQAGGADRALTVSFRNLRPNPQGRLDLSFAPANNYACLNALEITDEGGSDDR
jgi:hypothetical protein